MEVMLFIVHLRSWLRGREFRSSLIFSMASLLSHVFLWLMQVCMLLYIPSLERGVYSRVELYMLWLEKDRHPPFSQGCPASTSPYGALESPRYPPSSLILAYTSPHC